MAGNGNWGAHGAGSVDQQAIAQVLSPVFDPGFVPVSYGFRPGKSAHDAVKVAGLVIEQGYRWVVEVDLDAFFDRVNHDILISRVARQVKDKRLLADPRLLGGGDHGRWCASAGRWGPCRVTARRCSRTSCSMISIRSSGVGGTGSSGMPMTSGSS